MLNDTLTLDWIAWGPPGIRSMHANARQVYCLERRAALVHFEQSDVQNERLCDK